MPTNRPITATLVPETSRMDVADKHFGIRFPLTVEPTIFQFATQLAPSYSGGYWHFYTIDGGGFFMAPKLDVRFPRFFVCHRVDFMLPVFSDAAA